MCMDLTLIMLLALINVWLRRYLHNTRGKLLLMSAENIIYIIIMYISYF